MSSQISAVPIRQRKLAVGVCAGFALFLLVVGLMPWLGHADTSVRIVAIIAVVAAVILALLSWGLQRSIVIDTASAALDTAINEAVAEAGIGCACGHEHDPDVLHFADEPAPGQQQAQHATGSSCGREQSCDHSSCASCTLSSLRS